MREASEQERRADLGRRDDRKRNGGNAPHHALQHCLSLGVPIRRGACAADQHSAREARRRDGACPRRGWAARLGRVVRDIRAVLDQVQGRIRLARSEQARGENVQAVMFWGGGLSCVIYFSAVVDRRRREESVVQPRVEEGSCRRTSERQRAYTLLKERGGGPRCHWERRAGSGGVQ
jgi:hypothetical protein